jgi:hypothetical protein
LKAAGGPENKNEDDIAKLTQLYQIVEQKEAEWQSTIQADQAQQMMAAQQAMAAQAGVPNAGPNVLSQEAQMTQTPMAPKGNAPQADLDVETPMGSAQNGQWNAPYSMQ